MDECKKGLHMEKTNHALKRMQQRGLSGAVLEFIISGGHYEQIDGGITKVFFGRKEHQHAITALKRIIRLVDRAKGGTMIIHQDRIVTVYKNRH